ncbi:MAG: hypothetical protein QM726_23100 [Chitinophagaceae bacterium]
MQRHVFAILLLFVFFLTACRQNSSTGNKPPVQDLFAGATDTSLLIKPVAPAATTITADSAYRTSTLVAVCTPILVDSTVHQNEKAWFYLFTIKIDTILKGPSYKGNIYFTTKRTPGFKPGSGNWLLFLNKQHNEKLLAYNGNVPWQWVENAPYAKPTPELLQLFSTLSPKSKKPKRKNKKPRPHVTLWILKRSTACPAKLLS